VTTRNPRVGDDVERAAEILGNGGLVAIPTETVYGLAAVARDVEAVSRVFTTKGRPFDHPLIVHVHDVSAAVEWAAEWGEAAERLSSRFWPGPLTIVVPRSDFVPDVVTGGLSTVALRVPDHPMTLTLLARLGDGVAAPSANRFGKVSPTTATHVIEDLGDDVDYVLDGGPCRHGLESTIVDCESSPAQILRPGAITEDDLVSVSVVVGATTGPSRAPGMLESHYAPRCTVRLHESMPTTNRVSGSEAIIDASANPMGFAHDMYDHLRRADAEGVSILHVVLPPNTGIGVAIRDRLTKAAASRQ
jgi:L-threonylcarbamoyladenylate synthase